MATNEIGFDVILFVEDDANHRALYEDVSTSLGIERVVVNNGFQAVASVCERRTPYAAVVSDFNLGNDTLNGADVLAMVRRRSEAKKEPMPVLVMMSVTMRDAQESIKDEMILRGFPRKELGKVHMFDKLDDSEKLVDLLRRK